MTGAQLNRYIPVDLVVKSLSVRIDLVSRGKMVTKLGEPKKIALVQ